MEKSQTYSQLYDYLREHSPEPIQVYQSKINTCSKKKSHTIYRLILEHYQRTQGNLSLLKNKIPYSGKKASKSGGVKYQIKDLPVDLQRIIAAYISQT